MLLGLKSDLRNKKNCIELLKTQGLTPVTPEQGRAVAKKMGAMYMECSSKEQDGVEEIFDTAVTIAVGDEWKTPETPSHTSRPTAGGHHRTISTMSDLPKKKKKGSKERLSRHTTLDDTIKMLNDHLITPSTPFAYWWHALRHTLPPLL
jgi:Ras family protein A